MKSIAIIGAGPVGCYTAYLLAKKGFNVEIYEEHSEVGAPFQCTGLLTNEINKIMDLDKSVINNRLKKVKVVCNGASAEIPVDEIVVSRPKFDKFFAKKAIEAGAKLFLSCRLESIEDGILKIKDIKNNKIKEIEPDHIIGADGPFSRVAKFTGLYQNRKFFSGVQSRIKGNYDLDTYEAYFGKDYPGFFAWIVPESDTTARIGYVAEKDESIKGIDNKFISGKCLDSQNGMIPIYKKIKVQKGNVYLVGDAALQVKATTAGGIIQGLKAARILAYCIEKNKNYNKKIKPLNRELWLHLKLKNVLSKFKDDDFVKLINLINQEKIKVILSAYSRDKPIPLVLNLLLKEPRFLYFLRYLLRSITNLG